MDRKAQIECPCSESIVSYIYNEMPTAKRTTFEDHLLECQICTDDFALVSEARFEVFDWKRVEFDPLAMPVIQVSYQDRERSLIGRIRDSWRWAAAVPAFALIVIAIGLGYTVWLTRTPAPEMSAVPVMPEEISPALRSVPPPTASLTSGPTLQDVTAPTSVKVTTKTTSVTQRRSTNPPHQAEYARSSVPRVKLSSDVAVNISPVAPKKLPRLGAYDDEDDTSLRLAELFDEAGPPQDQP